MMEQQQTGTVKVSFSVATKILLSVLVLLAIVIAFLNVSAILLLREDKRAYTYQSQSTAAVLAGREFSSRAKHEFDTLRIALGMLDPIKPLLPQQAAALRTLVDNQSDLAAVSIFNLRSNEVMVPYAQAARAKEMTELGLTAQDTQLEKDWLLAILPELKESGFAFVNLSRVDGTAILGLLVADLQYVTRAAGMPVALGIASLKDYASDLGGMNLTVATKSGWVLFDTDPTALFGKRNLKSDLLFKSAVASRLATGTQEYDEDGKHFLASFTQPGYGLVVFARTDWKKAIRATYELIIKFALLGVMAVGAALVFSVLFSKTLTRPINRLYEATKEVAKGNFNLNLQIRSRDEIGALTGSFNAMSVRISELIQEQAEKIRLENEISIASTVQQTLIPPPEYLSPEVVIHSRYQAAQHCGGDWWGFFTVGKKLCVLIADATGHGLPCALITASARSCFSVLQKLAQEESGFNCSPNAFLSYANRVVHDASHGKIMMTFFAAVIDFEEMQITYSSAGHNPPWLYSNGPNGIKSRSLVAEGNRLGESEEVPPFSETTIPFAAGDTLILYTDGLLEGKDLQGNVYGKKRSRKLIEQELENGTEAIVNTLVGDFMQFNEGKPLDDDLTLAVMKFSGVGAKTS